MNVGQCSSEFYPAWHQVSILSGDDQLKMKPVRQNATLWRIYIMCLRLAGDHVYEIETSHKAESVPMNNSSMDEVL